MSSESDPMVHELSAAVWNDAIYETEGRGESQTSLIEHLQQVLTARLAAAQPSREDIREAISDASLRKQAGTWPELIEVLTDAVMAVLKPEQGGE